MKLAEETLLPKLYHPPEDIASQAWYRPLRQIDLFALSVGHSRKKQNTPLRGLSNRE
jgi:hypothetical protein